MGELFDLIGVAATGGAAFVGWKATREFVVRRLRFVPAVRQARAPVVAGVVAGMAALPVVWLLPLVTTGSALIFGAAVGVGVASGARDIGRRLPRG